jgi:hypothetical protein
VTIVPTVSENNSGLDDQKVLFLRIREMAGGSPELLERSGFDESRLSNIKVITTSYDVRVGDAVHEGLYDNVSVPFRVTKIDDKGVTINDRLFEYSKSSLQEVRTGGSFLLTTITRPEKGPNGAATLFITHV